MTTMFKIKRKGRENALRLHNAIKTQFYPLLSIIGERLRLKGRIRWANIWAKSHPKRLMFNYSAFAVLLLGFTLLFDGYQLSKNNDDTQGLHSIPSMRHRLQSLNNSEIQHEKIRQGITALGQKGMKIYNELDSLMKLPNKTHEDSVRIYRNYEILNNTFNSHGNKL